MQAALENQAKLTKKGFFSLDLIHEIRERTDIVQIIGEYTKLTPSGKSFKGLCPIHKEKTPSFFVHPEKRIYHCFGCAKGGDVFQFLAELERYTFPEAVAYLARRCGVPLPSERTPEDDKRTDVYEVLEQAAKLFYAQLVNAGVGEKARSYLKNRGLSGETARQFRMGFAPDSWEFLTRRLGQRPGQLEILQRAGLVKPRQNGEGYYDTFRNRIMIPITDVNGRVIAFGGRSIDPGQEPKYLNSPETDVFNKRKTLFNYKLAISEIRKQNAAVLVEGYLDVISLEQHGIHNVVATLGTAVTAEQINILGRNCERVYLCYDADDAGQKATLRAISLQRESPLDARVIAFDDASDDPDSFIQREGAESFQKRLEASRDIYTYLIESKTRGLKKPLDITAKERLVAELKGIMPVIHSPLARSEIVRNIAQLLDTDASLLEKMFFSHQVEGQTRPSSQDVRTGPPAPGRHPAGGPVKKIKEQEVSKAALKQQEWVIKHLIDTPQEIDRVKDILIPADFSDPQLKVIYETICLKNEAMGRNLSPAEILNALDDAGSASRLSELLIALEDQPSEPFLVCIHAMAKSRLEKENLYLQTQIAAATKSGNESEVTRLLTAHIQVRRKLEMLKRNP